MYTFKVPLNIFSPNEFVAPHKLSWMSSHFIHKDNQIFYVSLTVNKTLLTYYYIIIHCEKVLFLLSNLNTQVTFYKCHFRFVQTRGESQLSSRESDQED